MVLSITPTRAPFSSAHDTASRAGHVNEGFAAAASAAQATAIDEPVAQLRPAATVPVAQVAACKKRSTVFVHTPTDA